MTMMIIFAQYKLLVYEKVVGINSTLLGCLLDHIDDIKLIYYETKV